MVVFSVILAPGNLRTEADNVKASQGCIPKACPQRIPKSGLEEWIFG